MSRFFAVCGMMCLVAGAAFGGIVQWNPVWSPQMGLDVKVERFTASNLSVYQALAILDSECGLVFRYADVEPPESHPHRLTLDLRSATVKQIVDAIARRSPEYSFNTYDGVVLVAPADPGGPVARVLNLKVDSFEAKNVSPGEVEGKVSDLLRTLRGMPELEYLHMGSSGVRPPGPDVRSPVSLEIHGGLVSAVLAKAAKATNESWVLAFEPDLKHVMFVMDGGFRWEWGGEHGVRLAPGAPRKPRLDEPPLEVIRQAAGAIIQKAESPSRDAAATARDLAALINDGWYGPTRRMRPAKPWTCSASSRPKTACQCWCSTLRWEAEPTIEDIWSGTQRPTSRPTPRQPRRRREARRVTTGLVSFAPWR